MPGPLQGRRDVIAAAAQLLGAAAPPLQWTAIAGGDSNMSRWIRAGDVAVPTGLNCWEAVLYLFVRAGIVDRPRLRASVPPGIAGVDSQLAFLTLFVARADVPPEQAAPGDVVEFVARNTGLNPPGYIGECQHVALVRRSHRGLVRLIELDGSRGDRRLHEIRLNIVLATFNDRLGGLGPWTAVVRRFVDWNAHS